MTDKQRWEPTVELRYVVRQVWEEIPSTAPLGPIARPVLQQKWIEYGPAEHPQLTFTDGRSGPITATGKVEWRDVPVVVEEHEPQMGTTR